MSDDKDRSERGRRRSRSGSGSRKRHRQRVKVKVRKRSTKKKRSIVKPAILGGAVLGAFLLVGFIVNQSIDLKPSAVGKSVNLQDRLPELPPNQWVKIGIPYTATWTRQRHAGAAYDLHRNKYFVFGSDTHGENWDNAIHEFDPLILRWSQHYEADRRRSYRVDEEGRPITGSSDSVRPWAMHVHGNLIYDPQNDALVALAAPIHNPAARAVRGIRQHPTWIYELRTRTWRPLDGPENVTPYGFAGASAYDPERDTILSYSRNGLWELGPGRQQWVQVSPDFQHEMYQSMVYDSLHRKFLVFGGKDPTCSIWVYTPGLDVGEMGSWEERMPVGDACFPDQHVPVAFDSHNAVALMVLDEPENEGDGKPAKSSTFVYDPETNAYRKLAGADLPHVGMNYTLVYDPSNRMFYMLMGGRKDPPTVWALHLELVEFTE